MEDEQYTEVDSSIVSKMIGKGTNKLKVVAAVSDLHGKLYNMKFPRRGRAIIFNHYKFDSGMPTREGTSKDCNKLEKVLTALGFEVTVFQDYKYGQIYDELDKVASDDHSDADCLLVSVLSHGESGTLHAKDTDYKLENLWNPFTGDSCSSLVGKPKLFFIQACRGKRVDVGVRVKSDASQVCSIPAMADILVMYSSFEGGSHDSKLSKQPQQAGWPTTLANVATNYGGMKNPTRSKYSQVASQPARQQEQQDRLGIVTRGKSRNAQAPFNSASV